MKPGTLVRLLRGTEYEKAVLWKLLEMDRHGYAEIEPTQPYRLAHPFGWPVYSTEKQLVFHTRIKEASDGSTSAGAVSGPAEHDADGALPAAPGIDEVFGDYAVLQGGMPAPVRTFADLIARAIRDAGPADEQTTGRQSLAVDRSLFPRWPFPGGYPQEMPE